MNNKCIIHTYVTSMYYTLYKNPAGFFFLTYGDHKIDLQAYSLIRVNPMVFRPKDPLVQIFRRILLVVGNTSFVCGAHQISYSKAIVILYVYPLLMMMLAPAILCKKGNLMPGLGCWVDLWAFYVLCDLTLVILIILLSSFYLQS